MSYQFAHLETFARKANKAGVNTKFVFDEVTRRNPEACRHVENPEPPQIVYGMSVDDLEALHDRMCDEARMTNAKGQTRAIRKDQHTLATVVLSYPGDAEPGIAPYEEWERRSVEWLKRQYGDDLKTVVRHTDEAHPHIHAYILPSNARAKEMHPGWLAKRDAEEAAKAEGVDKKSALKAGNRAYRQTMRAWQDSFYEEVGRPCGLTRIGPKRRRLTREQHTIEKDMVKRARQAELLIEEASRLDAETKARAEAVYEKEAILAEDVGDGWFSKHAKAKKLAELTAAKTLEQVKEKARREGLDSARPAFRKLKGQAQRIVNELREENGLLKEQNALLLIETSKPQDHELFLDIAETTLRDLVDLQNEKALETGEPDAYRDLSGTCEKAALFGKRADRDGIIDHVKGVVSDVKDRARSMFQRFFDWTKGSGEIPQPPPAPANASPQATPLAPVKRGPAPF